MSERPDPARHVLFEQTAPARLDELISRLAEQKADLRDKEVAAQVAVEVAAGAVGRAFAESSGS